jgi:cellulose synthase/poly-beta-1,6-N-acetylglucosamine synthase-like glycosyltransferase
MRPFSIIVAAYNEERFIRDKILSLMAKEGWIEGSELIVVSAGSTDSTNVILDEFRGQRDIVLMIYQEHLTKIDAVNLAVSRSKNEILVFSDCRQRMKSGSIRSLLYNFSDESVGTVTGTLVNIKGSKVSQIRTLLNCVALAQSKNGSCLNVFGALYAQRKSVYRTIPNDIIFDDLFVAVSTIVQGRRLIQEKEAIIYDVDFNRYYSKERLERLARGLLMFLWNHTALIMQLPLGFLIRFLGFKYLKLVCPFLLIMSIACALYLVIPVMSVQIMTIAGLLLMIAFGIKESRDIICLFVRANVYFTTAVVKFICVNRQDTSWRQLELDQFQE